MAMRQLRVIRKMNNSDKSMIPIIASNGFCYNLKSVIKIERYKMNGYVSKPFNVNELHQLLKFYSGKKQPVE